jgi:hypothetical protein
MVIIVLMTFSCLSLMSMGQQIRTQSLREMLVMQSKGAADAGLYCATYMVQQQISGGASWTGINSATDVALPGTNATYSYTVTGSPSTQIAITATGKCGSIQRTVNCTIKGQSSSSPYWIGMASRDRITLGSAMKLRTIPSTQIATLLTNRNTVGSIIMNNNADVIANLVAGPGASLNPSSSALPTNLGNVTWSGTKSVATDATVFSSVAPPSTGVFAGAAKAAITAPPATMTPAQNGKYAGFSISGKTVRISGGDVVLYVTGATSIGDNSKIVIDSGSTLTLYIDGSFQDADNVSIASQSGDPTTSARSFKLLGTDKCTSVTIKSKTNFCGAVYAPNATINVSNNAVFTGAVAGKILTMMDNVKYNYVAALAQESMCGGSSAPTQAKMDRWWE